MRSRVRRASNTIATQPPGFRIRSKRFRQGAKIGRRSCALRTAPNPNFMSPFKAPVKECGGFSLSRKRAQLQMLDLLAAEHSHPAMNFFLETAPKMFKRKTSPEFRLRAGTNESEAA